MVASVGVSVITIPALVERTRDSADEVRRTAFLTVANKVSLAALSIAQRATLLRRGLAERVDDVRKAALVMLGKFLKGANASAWSCEPGLTANASAQPAATTSWPCSARWTSRRTRCVRQCDRAAALSLTSVPQSVAETLLGELIAGGVIKPTDVALAGGANGAACNVRHHRLGRTKLSCFVCRSAPHRRGGPVDAWCACYELARLHSQRTHLLPRVQSSRCTGVSFARRSATTPPRWEAARHWAGASPSQTRVLTASTLSMHRAPF